MCGWCCEGKTAEGKARVRSGEHGLSASTVSVGVRVCGCVFCVELVGEVEGRCDAVMNRSNWICTRRPQCNQIRAADRFISPSPALR